MEKAEPKARQPVKTSFKNFPQWALADDVPIARNKREMRALIEFNEKVKEAQSNDKEILTRNVNLAATIALKLGTTTGIKHMITAIVGLSKTPESRKETIIYLVDSIMRHAVKCGEMSLKTRFERHLEPHLPNIVKRMLRPEETRVPLAKRLMERFMRAWRQKNWFMEALADMEKVIIHAVPSMKDSVFLGAETPMVNRDDGDAFMDDMGDAGARDFMAVATAKAGCPATPAQPIWLKGVPGTPMLGAPTPGTPTPRLMSLYAKTELMAKKEVLTSVPMTPMGLNASLNRVPTTPAGMPMTPRGTAIPSTPIGAPRTPGVHMGVKQAAPSTPGIPSGIAMPFTPRPGGAPLAVPGTPGISPVTHMPFTPGAAASNAAPFTPGGIGAAPYTPMPGSRGASRVPMTPGVGAPQPYTPMPGSTGAGKVPSTPVSATPSGKVPSTPGVGPATPGGLAPATPAYIGGHLPPQTPGGLAPGTPGIRASAPPGTPGFVPMAGGHVAPQTPAPGAGPNTPGGLAPATPAYIGGHMPPQTPGPALAPGTPGLAQPQGSPPRPSGSSLHPSGAPPHPSGPPLHPAAVSLQPQLPEDTPVPVAGEATPATMSGAPSSPLDGPPSRPETAPTESIGPPDADELDQNHKAYVSRGQMQHEAPSQREAPSFLPTEPAMEFSGEAVKRARDDDGADTDDAKRHKLAGEETPPVGQQALTGDQTPVAVHTATGDRYVPSHVPTEEGNSVPTRDIAEPFEPDEDINTVPTVGALGVVTPPKPGDVTAPLPGDATPVLQAR